MLVVTLHVINLQGYRARIILIQKKNFVRRYCDPPHLFVCLFVYLCVFWCVR